MLNLIKTSAERIIGSFVNALYAFAIISKRMTFVELKVANTALRLALPNFIKRKVKGEFCFVVLKFVIRVKE